MTEVSTLLSQEWSPDAVSVEKVDLSRWEGQEKFCIVLSNILFPCECQALIDYSESKKYEPALINVGGGRQVLMTDTRNNDRCIYDDPVTVERIWQRILAATAVHDPRSLDILTNIPFVNDRLRRGHISKTFRAVGLNERMRYLRYDPGTYFAPHYDGSYVRSHEAGPERVGEQSFVTFQVYLNEGFRGGSTRFLSRHDRSNHDDGEAEGADPPAPSIWPAFLTSPKRAKSNNPHYDVVPRAGSVLLFQHDCCHEGARVLAGRKYAIRSDVMYTTQGPGWEYSCKPIELQVAGSSEEDANE